MGWFSKTEDYDVSSSRLGNDEPSFETKYGIHHEIHSDGTTKTTNWDAESNTRYSSRTDADGNTFGGHSTDQNKEKGDPDRH